ncbi:MAG TPA: GIY-YIG nuclease family protein [Methanocorpusculum sp.]|jgi:hypothetical protein|nr:GIY-YIG nuclease family protein [Methanocorpusculum sp.]
MELMQIIFHDGKPDGIRTCMRRLSPMKAYVIPRSCLSDAKNITGINNPGIYFLINDEGGILTEIYIGQTRKGIERMNDHKSHKGFWNKAVLFLGDSEHFTLNIISGLEKYAIQKALESNRYTLFNKIDPQYQISEYDQPLIVSIYEEIEFIMATLGYKMNAGTSGSSVTDGFRTSRRDIVAFGVYNGDSFDVLPESEIDYTHKVNLESYNQLRANLFADGAIVKRGDKYYLTKVISFKSPSGASDFVLGGSTNGWVEWKRDGKTLNDIFRVSKK